MEVAEAREHLRDAERLFLQTQFSRASELCLSNLSGLPHDGTAADALIDTYELLIRMRLKEGLSARAQRVYRQYLDDCALACDAEYDRIYLEGVSATGSRLVPLRRRDRFSILVRLFRETPPGPGLVAECGCYLGLSSYLLCATLKTADRRFDGRGYRIFDSFSGLSAPAAEDAIEDTHPDKERIVTMTQEGRFAAPLDTVRANLGAYPGIEYFPGWIPEAFPAEPDDRYRFVHLDVDLYQPTRDSLEYFYPRLVPGGRIVCDDYGWPGPRKALDEFSRDTRVELATTPYKQAWLEKKA